MNRPFIFAIIAFALFGCGGGRGGGGPTLTVNQGSVKFEGSQLVPNFASSGSSVYSLTGAITRATFADLTPTIEETEIFVGYRTAEGTYRISAMDPSGNGLRTVCAVPDVPSNIRVSPAGTWVYFTLGTSLYRILAAGGSLVPILSNVSDYSLTTSGAKIVYYNSAGFGWFRANADGTTPVLITASLTHQRCIGCVSDTAVWVMGTGDPFPVSSMDINTGGILDSVSIGNVTMTQNTMRTNVTGLPAWGLVTITGTGGYQKMTTLSLAETSYRVTGPGIGGDIECSPQPDGKGMVTANGPLPSVFVHRPGTGSVLIFEPAGFVGGLGWGPFISSRSFVGSGLYTTGACATLFSENGNRLPGLVLADCVTRTSAVLQKVSPDAGNNVVFRLDCDNLSKLHYSNLMTYALTGVVTSATGLKGAFISFNAENGNVTSVVTFTRAPAVRKTATGLRLEGDGIFEHVITTGKTPQKRSHPSSVEL